MARQRNYRAEEARRNELARQRGFTSRAQQRRAVSKGSYPSARAIKTDPVSALLARQADRDRRNARSQDDESQRWSDQHSKQDSTRFNRRWPAVRKAAYYQAFVRWWRVPGDERDFHATYDYLIDYGFAEPNAYDDNPYQS